MNNTSSIDSEYDISGKEVMNWIITTCKRINNAINKSNPDHVSDYGVKYEKLCSELSETLQECDLALMCLINEYDIDKFYHRLKWEEEKYPKSEYYKEEFLLLYHSFNKIIDMFFNNCRLDCDDKKLGEFRICILDELRNRFLKLGVDFSKLQISK